MSFKKEVKLRININVQIGQDPPPPAPPKGSLCKPLSCHPVMRSETFWLWLSAPHETENIQILLLFSHGSHADYIVTFFLLTSIKQDYYYYYYYYYCYYYASNIKIRVVVMLQLSDWRWPGGQWTCWVQDQKVVAIVRILFLWLVFTNAGVKVAVVIEKRKKWRPCCKLPRNVKGNQ